jgi:hypothetical protein
LSISSSLYDGSFLKSNNELINTVLLKPVGIAAPHGLGYIMDDVDCGTISWAEDLLLVGTAGQSFDQRAIAGFCDCGWMSVRASDCLRLIAKQQRIWNASPAWIG